MIHSADRIYIQLNSSEYGPGDQVDGFVHLQLSQSYPTDTIFIKIDGVEMTALDRVRKGGKRGGRGSGVQIVEDKKFLISETIPVYKFPDVGIAPGYYQIPISFVIPHGLPSSFEHRFTSGGWTNPRHLYAIVKYQLKAFLQIPAGGINGLPMIVNEQPFYVKQNIKQLQKVDIKKQKLTDQSQVGYA